MKIFHTARFIAARHQGGWLKTVVAGLIEPPPAMVREIAEWVKAMKAAYKYPILQKELSDYKKHVLGDSDVSKNTVMEMEEELTQYEAMMKDYGKSPGYWKSLTKSFKANLEGWKYKSIVDQASPEAVQKANSMYGKIRVLLTSSEMRGSKVAVWDGNTSTLKLSIGLWDLDGTIEHELIHWTSDYLTIITGGKSTFGLPSRAIQTPGITQSPSKENKNELLQKGISSDAFHSLDDREFYTDLRGAISQFKLYIGNESVKRTWKTPHDFFLAIIGQNPLPKELSLHFPIQKAHNFFLALKQHAPGKWQKAVSELAKAVP